MPLRVTCGNCQKSLKAADNLAGKKVRCPGCSFVIQIPKAAVTSDDFFESESAPSELRDEPERKPQQKPTPKRKSDLDPEFDWSQPLEPTAESPSNDEFENFEDLPSLPKKARKTKSSPKESGPAFVPRLGDEGPSMATRRKDTSRPKRSEYRREVTGIGLRHWILALALIPLAMSILLPSVPIHDRLENLFREHPELEAKLNEVQSQEEFFSILPDGRVPGAHLAKETLLHWGYAAASATIFLVLIIALFPGVQIGPGQLILFGILTGTIGILMLIAFQWVAAFTMGFNIRGRGIIVALFYLVKFIGFSYRCATDPQTGFALSFIGFTCGVGLCEELCKGLPIAIYIGMSDRCDWKSACLVGLASGIGFGVSEGIMYSADYYNGIAPGLTYMVRFASCVTLHAVWASSVAMLMYNNQDFLPGNVNLEFGADTIFWFVVAYLGIAAVLHGLYDTLLKKDMDLAALTVAAASFAWWAWLLHYQPTADTD